MDVNTGSAKISGHDHMIKMVNCEAAMTLAREIRLRNLAGLIVIDFIKMRKAKHREVVLETLRNAVLDDPQQVFIGGFTRFGLVEVTRRRRGPSLSAFLCGKPSPPEKSPATAALEALRRLRHQASLAPEANFTLKTSEIMLHILECELAQALSDVRNQIGGRFKVECSKTRATNTYFIECAAGDGNA